MKRILLIAMTLCLTASLSKAQDNSNRFCLGVGALYKNTLEATLSYERETKYHNMWEFFATANLKWTSCPCCGHVCPKSFWNNYNIWGVGAAYKPCVVRSRNNHGNIRIGASGGGDWDKFVAGLHLGYEHNYSIKGGWKFFWQARGDVMINGQDLFRVGAALGVKMPL